MYAIYLYTYIWLILLVCSYTWILWGVDISDHSQAPGFNFTKRMMCFPADTMFGFPTNFARNLFSKTYIYISIVPGPTPINLLAIFNLKFVQDEQKSGFSTPDVLCSGGLLWIFRISSWVFFHLPVVVLAILVSPSTAFWGNAGGGKGFSDGLVVNDPRMHPTNVFVFIYSTVMWKGGCF